MSKAYINVLTNRKNDKKMILGANKLLNNIFRRTMIVKNILIASLLILFLDFNSGFKIEISFLNEDENIGHDLQSDMDSLENTNCTIHETYSVPMEKMDINSMFAQTTNSEAIYLPTNTSNENPVILSNEIIPNLTIEDPVEPKNIDAYIQEKDFEGSTANINFPEIFSNALNPNITFSESHEHEYSSISDIGFIITNNSSIIFDYSDEFVIRSKYFDKKCNSNSEMFKLNISEITSGNIDIFNFGVFLASLRFGYDPISFGLQKDFFLIFIELFYDLNCYSQFKVFQDLFKNLYPFFVSYKMSIDAVSSAVSTEEDLKRYRRVFLPFLSLFYGSIDTFFDAKKNELLFLEKSHYKKIYVFEKNDIKTIRIRTLPNIINLMIKTDLGRENHELFIWIVSLYDIDGIRVSADNSYYSECIDSDLACKFLCAFSNVTDIKPVSLTCLLNDILNISKHSCIKLLELERVYFCKKMPIQPEMFPNLETLILVKCILNKNCKFLTSLHKYFRNLKVLRIVGFSLYEGFFKNLVFDYLEFLDLSCCRSIDVTQQMNFLLKKCEYKWLKIDYSEFNVMILNFLIDNVSLQRLSLRNVNFDKFMYSGNFYGRQSCYYYLDISMCRFDRFYSTNYLFRNLAVWMLSLERSDCNECKIILSQESLHNSTRNLSLRGSILDVEISIYLKMFKYLENLNISDLPIKNPEILKNEFLLYVSLLSIDLSNLTIDKEELLNLSQFNNLRDFKITGCNLSVSFIKDLHKMCLYESLEYIDTSTNKLGAYDLYFLKSAFSLTHLILMLETNIFSNFDFKLLGPCFKKLKVLILAQTFVDENIFEFI
ncbi:hypothetical protein CWI36_0732p0020 [Hamiltosporidium magnivora]|uniref:Leucine-rich repeat-containing protein n=1 Tax=Hamiltosporidium magnivora TaxID=148818 RepID=A0A4V2JVM6_9MICR|nr:hypothetical protein CWI36_0732p0020 [Hamiltosporidium magnivora]